MAVAVTRSLNILLFAFLSDLTFRMFENVNSNMNLSQNKVTSLKRECHKPPSLYLVPKHVNKQTSSDRNGFVITSCSVTKSILCDPMDYSIPGLPVTHHLPEFTQVHVH